MLRTEALFQNRKIPYYQATGDSRYISPYKRDFSQNIAYRLNYTDIKYPLYEVYKHGMKIIADRYPRFIVDDFYSLNLSFKETASEEFSLEGGFSGKFVKEVVADAFRERICSNNILERSVKDLEMLMGVNK